MHLYLLWQMSFLVFLFYYQLSALAVLSVVKLDLFFNSITTTCFIAGNWGKEKQFINIILKKKTHF